MAETVDAIIGALELRIDEYRQNALAVIQLNKDLRKSILGAGGDDKDLGQAGTRRAQAEEQTTDRVVKTRKARTAAVKQSANDEVVAEKAAADAKRQIAQQSAADQERLAQQVLTSRRRARLQELQDARQAESAVAAPTAPRAAIIGGAGNGKSQEEYEAQLARTAAARAVIPTGNPISNISLAAPVANDAEAAAAKEINHALADRYDITQKLKVAEGENAAFLRAELEFHQRIDVYRRAGLTDAQAVVRADAEALAVEKLRTEQAEKQALASRDGSGRGTNNALRFAEGAGLGRSGGSAAAIGGIVAGATIAGVAELAKQGLEYAQSLKQDSDQLGLTTRDLQIYRTAAQAAGLSTEQFKEGIGQLADNLGKAQEGSKAQGLIFQRLHIDVGNAQDGYKTLSEVLPTLSDRLSQITDKTQRQAVEQALGGEQLRKMDPILAQGAASFDAYGESIEKAGGILSNSEIQRSAETAKKIALLNDQLQRDLASTVSQNAGAIEDLATAFFRLADGAFKAFGYLRQVDALDVLNGGLSSRVREAVTGKPQAQDQAENFQYLLGTDGGRKTLLDRNTQQLNALNLADKGKGLSGPGLGDIGDDPKDRYAAHQRALAERAQITAAQRKADAENNPPPVPVQPGHPDGNVLAGPDKKGPKGKSPEDLATAEIERTKQFNDQLASLQEQALRAQESMTGSIQERAADEKKLADAQYEKRIGDINSQLEKQLQQIAKDYPKGGGERFANEARQRAGTLRGAAGIARDSDQAARDQQTAIDLARANNAHAQTSLSISATLLDDQLALAKTASERRDIEQKLLDNAKEREKADLTTQLATLKPGDPARADVQTRLNNVDADYAAKGKANDRRNAGPLQSYYDSLPGTGKEIGEALQGAAVSGAEKLNDALDESVKKMLKLHGVAGDILNDFIKIALQAGEKALFSALLNGVSGGGGGGLLGSIGKLFGGGKATGGPVSGSQFYVVGEHGPEIFAPGQSGSIIPNHAIGSANGRVSSPAVGGPVVHQTIQYSGAVDIADKNYVNQMGQALHKATTVAIQQSSVQTLNASPARVQRQQTLGN